MEARYRRIVEAQAELISLSRRDGTLVYVNPAYARHHGTTPEAMVGRSLYDSVPPDERDVVRAHIDGVFASGTLASGENRLLDAAGRERWFSWTNLPHVEVGGEPLLHSVGRDVTERVRAEEALRASRAFLDRTGRVAGVGGWQLDIASSELVWSEQTRRIHDVPPEYRPTVEEAIRFYAPEAQPVIQEAVRTAIEHGTAWDLELPMTTATGRRIWVRAVGEVEREHGVAVRLVGAFQDITERKRLENELREFKAILDNSPDYILQTDASGTIGYLNRAARAVLGLSAEGPVPAGLDFDRFNTPATQALFASAIVPAPLKRDGKWVGETAFYAADGREVPVSHVVLAHRDANQRLSRFSGVLRDISGQIAAQRKITQRTAMLRSITEAIPAVIAVVDTERRYRFVNSAFERWIGAPRDRVIGRTMREVLGRAVADHLEPWAARALAGETVNFEREQHVRNEVRHLSTSYMPLWDEGGGVDGFVGMLHDVTQHRHAEGRLMQLAHGDALTGLLNRSGFLLELERRIAEGRGASLALLYIDLDRFKQVNDTHGHAVGDEVLKHFAQRLRALVRGTDAVARLGGDEFVVLLGDVTDAAPAHRIASQIVAAAGQPFVSGGLRLQIGASVGIALGAHGEQPAADLLARADTMLYRAKTEGRGRLAA